MKIYQVVNKAKSDFIKTCNFAKEVEIKVNMFQAAFEHYLFTALIKNNKKAMFRGDSEPQNGTIMLEIPSSFPFVSFIFKLKFYYLVTNLKKNIFVQKSTKADKIKKTAENGKCLKNFCN